jgi:hypothetical protein
VYRVPDYFDVLASSAMGCRFAQSLTLSVASARPSSFQSLLLLAASLFAFACGGDAVENGPNTSSGAMSGAAGATVCTISASSYDQSCAVDTDCEEVTSTDYCASSCLCGGSAINANALMQFKKDVAKTPLGSGSLSSPGCPCPPSFGPCCRGGKCTETCVSASDPLPACADAGGACILEANSTCGKSGPSTSCAYPDEICCLN